MAVEAAGAVVGSATAVSKGLYRRLPRKVRRIIFMPLAAAVLLLAGVAGMMVYYTVTFPDPLSLRHRERADQIRILARDGTVLGQRGGSLDYIPLDLLPRLVVDAVVATEDRRFNEHWGLDPVGLVRASFANLRAGRFAQGGSTLTQQLAKNLFLTPERTMARKLEELLLAFWLELRLSKAEILELYLNRVYFGGGAYGIEAASLRFFDKSARELSTAEAAVVAGLLKAPSKYAPSANPEAARARGRAVLAKMRDAGVITAAEEKAARAEVVRFADGNRSSAGMGTDYTVDYVLEKLPALVGHGQTDIVVETTIDSDLQRKAHEIVRKELVLQGSTLSADQGAVTVLDTEGGIRALVGGRAYAESQFNRAIKARRQPGSAFKPFLYLAALEAGYSPISVAYDLPISVEGWAPKNDNGKYAGAVTLDHAVAHSINTVAVRLILDLGARRVADVAHRLGIKSSLREDYSLALGTSEVSLLELTSAYAPFANGGRAVEHHIIRRVRSGSGRVLYARTAPPSSRAVEARHVGAMNTMLHGVMTHGTGRRANLQSQLSAGKTGTSQDYRDAWFVGYTAHLIAGVWIGNDNGATMGKVRGGQLPADIWRQIMQSAHAGRTPRPLPGMEPYEQRAPGIASPAVQDAAPAETAAIDEVEVLPWLVAKPSETSVPARGPTTNVARGVPPRTHPTSSIDPDLIARALGEPIAPRPLQPLPSGRIVVRPPPGLMSLGRVPDGSRDAGEEETPVETPSCGLWSRMLGGC